MFSFLPEQQRKVLVREYRIRLSVVIFSGLFLVLLVATILELPAYFFSKIKMYEVSDIAKMSANDEDAKNVRIAFEEIYHTNAYVGILSKESEPKLYEGLDKIIKLRGAVLINSFAISRKEDASSSVMTITGRAPKREDLVNFSKVLKAEPTINVINLPVSDLVKTKDINFNMTISGKF